MSDERLRELERTDFRRWRIELLRLSRAAEAGFAVGDTVSFYENPMASSDWPRPVRCTIKGFWPSAPPHVERKDGTWGAPEGWHSLQQPGVTLSVLDEEKDRFPRGWRLTEVSFGGGGAIKLLEVGPLEDPREVDYVPDVGGDKEAVPRWQRQTFHGDAALHDALVLHFATHPFEAIPTEPGLYRTDFDPREDCPWCSKGIIAVFEPKLKKLLGLDRYKAAFGEVSVIAEGHVAARVVDYPKFEQAIMESLWTVRPVETNLHIEELTMERMAEAYQLKWPNTPLLATHDSFPARARDKACKHKSAERTRENVRRRPPRRI